RMSRVNTTRAAIIRPLRFRVLRKLGIRVLCALRSELAPEACRRCQPTNTPTAMTATMIKSADDPTACHLPAEPARRAWRITGRQRQHFPGNRPACRRRVAAAPGGAALLGAGGGPDVDARLGGVPVYLGQFLLGEGSPARRGHVLLQLRHAARADQHR